MSKACKSAVRVRNAGAARRARTDHQDRRPRFRCPCCKRAYLEPDPPYEREEIPGQVAWTVHASDVGMVPYEIVTRIKT